jgi:hypothetical protein
MKEIWAHDQKSIMDEINRLITAKIPIVISRNDFLPKTVFAREILAKKNATVVRLDKQEKFTPPAGPSFFFYRPLEYLTRGFQGTPLHDTEEYLLLLPPHEIFQIQRRKFPRVITPGDSHALFTTLGGAKLLKVSLKDVSLEGAYMQGTLSYGIKPGATIGPISLTLYLQNKFIEAIKIHVPQANVVRLVDEGTIQKLAINFKVQDKAYFELDNYINLRSMEETIGGA